MIYLCLLLLWIYWVKRSLQPRETPKEQLRRKILQQSRRVHLLSATIQEKQYQINHLKREMAQTIHQYRTQVESNG